MNLIDILFIPINKIKKTIGKTDDTGGSSTAGTVMGKLNNIISNSPSSSIGNTADTGGSATSGTVFGKLNAVLNHPNKYSMKTLNWTPVANVVYEIDIQGKGVFYGIYSTAAQNVNGSSSYMVIDGTTYNIPAGDSSSSALNFQPKSTGYGLYWSNYGATSGMAGAKPDEYGYLEFSQSLSIRIKTTTALPFVLHYSILE
jgi:hypothetical protein